LRRVALLLAAVALAAGLGVLGAWLVGDDSQSPAGQLGPVAGAAEVAFAGDPAIKFPPTLESLETPPFDLVTDPQTGELWFPIFSDKGHKLYRYDPTTDGLSHYDLPSDPGGTGLFSAILVDERGHVLVGYGLTVADFDAVAEKFAVFALPETPANLEVLDANMKPFITDMIALDGKLLIGRLNTAALTELDTNNGDVMEHPIPSSFGCAINMVAAADGVYMSNWIGLGKERQVARLDIKTDAFESLSFAASALAADAQGHIVATRMDQAALASIDGTLASSLDVKEAGDILSGINDALAVDGRSGALWFTGNRGTIARLDPATSAVTVYELPRYVVPADVIRGFAGEPTDQIQATGIGGLAVDAEGNLYFSDQTAKRIGIIPAP
jgi:streptogramin lyase